MRKMSAISRNVCVDTFASVVDSFVDRCLWQVTIKHFYNVNKHVGWHDVNNDVICSV